MKPFLACAGAVIAACLVLPAQAQTPAGDQVEINYAPGSLAFAALMSGDNKRAIDKLSQTPTRDPAKLINLGRALAREGRTDEAARMFQAAIDSPRRFDLLLADGSVLDSREAARRSLVALSPSVASR